MSVSRYECYLRIPFSLSLVMCYLFCWGDFVVFSVFLFVFD